MLLCSRGALLFGICLLGQRFVGLAKEKQPRSNFRFPDDRQIWLYRCQIAAQQKQYHPSSKIQRKIFRKFYFQDFSQKNSPRKCRKNSSEIPPEKKSEK